MLLYAVVQYIKKYSGTSTTTIEVHQTGLPLIGIVSNLEKTYGKSDQKDHCYYDVVDNKKEIENV